MDSSTKRLGIIAAVETLVCFLGFVGFCVVLGVVCEFFVAVVTLLTGNW